MNDPIRVVLIKQDGELLGAYCPIPIHLIAIDVIDNPFERDPDTTQEDLDGQDCIYLNALSFNSKRLPASIQQLIQEKLAPLDERAEDEYEEGDQS